MPVRRRGYHRWKGKLSSARWTWPAILSNGLRLGMKQKGASLLLWSGLPIAVVAGLLFYFMAVLEKQTAHPVQLPNELRFILWFLRMDRIPSLDIGKLIVPMWTLVFARLFQLELLLILLVQSKFGANQIAGDLRTDALPIYFSKPITVWTYLLGKWLIMMAFASAVMLVPNLVAYVAGVLLSDTVTQFRATAGLLARITAHSLLLAGLSSLIILALSSLTRDRRLVSVAWFAIALLPIAIQAVLDDAVPGRYATGLLGAVSLQRNFGRLTYWMLDVDGAVTSSGHAKLFGSAAGSGLYGADLGYSVAVLAAITAVCLLICLKRVRRFQVAVANA